MIRKAAFAGALGAVLLVSACETTTPAAGPTAAAFNRDAFSWSTQRGSGRIDGQLTSRPRGLAYSCQSVGVVLTPETPWVRQRMNTLYRSTERAAALASEVRARMPAESHNYDAFVRRAPCDAQGRFTFTGLPDGAWYVITSGEAAGGEPMAFMRRIVIRNGGAVRVQL